MQYTILLELRGLIIPPKVDETQCNASEIIFGLIGQHFHDMNKRNVQGSKSEAMYYSNIKQGYVSAESYLIIDNAFVKREK